MKIIKFLEASYRRMLGLKRENTKLQSKVAGPQCLSILHRALTKAQGSPRQ
ncbi:hypothetical protein [Zongyangia hominis]|uniref:Uncharacterized protein n=1 Tax=Zongyangia hominis TaxID=2763677 RepID=A0A926I759_9FIRM|nr:hypothetical protein [Zongyangia hominis]MBC8570734.1 hypothetical protein [Zongyangia hominis]